MIDPKYLGPDVDRTKISPDARIVGESYLTGPTTSVAAGAVIENSRLENVTVASGAKIVDSIVTVQLPIRSHHCDAAGHFIAAGTDRPEIGTGATVQGSTLINSSVASDASIESCWISNSHVGQRNRLDQVKMLLCHCKADISLFGPTEFSESHLGHGLSVDQAGFFEAVFSNTFHVLDFNASTGRLVIRRTIDLPHTSRYGRNVICSTNSGRLKPQKNGRPLRSLGPRVRLWHDTILSHELMRTEPCCWVSGWTKLIGESADAYETDEAMMNDRRATLVMPFAVAGFQGDATRGLVMPGERATGVRPEQRFPAWTFTYAPGAVIAMVRRVHDLLPPEQQSVADDLVIESIRTALSMVEAVRHTEQDPQWHDWADRADALLSAHIESDLWQFEGGRTCEWRQDTAGVWTHPRLERLMKLVPDMLDAQVGEADLFSIDGKSTALHTTGSTPLSFSKQDSTPTTIDPTAQIPDDAFIGPGCQIGPDVTIGHRAQLWNATLEACEIGDDVLVERCRLIDTKIGSEVTLRSSVVEKSQVGNHSTVESARIIDSTLADHSTIYALADLKDVSTKCGTILGGQVESTRIGTCLMTMHMAGRASGIEAETTPVVMKDGQTVHVRSIPMIGGGSQCDGTPDASIRLEGCFIGSNAQIESGVRLGFGAFVLGRIGPNVELPPFTLAFGGDPTTYRLGQVLTRLPDIVVSHFLSWTYQASKPEEIEAVARMVESSIERGLAAVRFEQARRSGDENIGASPLFDLTCYTDAQLEGGRTIYEQSLASGVWRMAVDAGELVFCTPVDPDLS